MGAYVGSRIIAGAYTYEFTVTNRPDLKVGIDAYLTQQGREDLITS